MSFDPLLLTVQPMKQIKRKEKVIFKRSRKQKSNKSELNWNHQNSNQEFRRCKYFAAFQKKTSNHKILDAVKTKDLFAASLNRRDCHHLWRHEISELCWETHELNSRFGTSKISCLWKAASNQSQRYRKNNEVPDDLNFFSTSIWIQVFGNYRETWFCPISFFCAVLTTNNIIIHSTYLGSAFKESFRQ